MSFLSPLPTWQCILISIEFNFFLGCLIQKCFELIGTKTIWHWGQAGLVYSRLQREEVLYWGDIGLKTHIGLNIYYVDLYHFLHFLIVLLISVPFPLNSSISFIFFPKIFLVTFLLSSVWLNLYLKLCHWFFFPVTSFIWQGSTPQIASLPHKPNYYFYFIQQSVYTVGLLHLKRSICPLPTLDHWNYPHMKNSATLRSSFYKVAVSAGKMKGFTIHWTVIRMARGCQSSPPFLLLLHLQGKASWGPFKWYPVVSLPENERICLHPPESLSNFSFHPGQNMMPTHPDNWRTVLWTRHIALL